MISAASSTKNDMGERDPEGHQTKKDDRWHFVMKQQISEDEDNSLLHTVTTNAADAQNKTKPEAQLHGQEDVFFAESGYWGVHKSQEVKV